MSPSQVSIIVKSLEETRDRVHFYCKNVWHAAFEIGECFAIIVACKILDEDAIVKMENCKRMQRLAECDFEETESVLLSIIHDLAVFECDKNRT